MTCVLQLRFWVRELHVPILEYLGDQFCDFEEGDVLS
jgi:hypothetical protein